MKTRFILYVLFVLACLPAFGQDVVCIDSTLSKEYEYFSTLTQRTIGNRHLSDSIKGCPYYAFRLGYEWIVCVKKPYDITVYHFNELKTQFDTYHFPKDTKDLNYPFLLADLNQRSDIRKRDSVTYHPITFDFILYDSNHNECFVWNRSSISVNHQNYIKYALEKPTSFFYAELYGGEKQNSNN